MRFAGIPQRPNPPTRSLALFGISLVASIAFGYILDENPLLTIYLSILISSLILIRELELTK